MVAKIKYTYPPFDSLKFETTVHMVLPHGMDNISSEGRISSYISQTVTVYRKHELLEAYWCRFTSKALRFLAKKIQPMLNTVKKIYSRYTKIFCKEYELVYQDMLPDVGNPHFIHNTILFTFNNIKVWKLACINNSGYTFKSLFDGGLFIHNLKTSMIECMKLIINSKEYMNSNIMLVTYGQCSQYKCIGTFYEMTRELNDIK